MADITVRRADGTFASFTDRLYRIDPSGALLIQRDTSTSHRISIFAPPFPIYATEKVFAPGEWKEVDLTTTGRRGD